MKTIQGRGFALKAGAPARLTRPAKRRKRLEAVRALKASLVRLVSSPDISLWQQHPRPGEVAGLPPGRMGLVLLGRQTNDATCPKTSSPPCASSRPGRKR